MGEAITLHRTGLTTAVGPIPPSLERYIQSIPLPQLPELTRLPRPGERDFISGGSRSWLIETNESLPPDERFLFRVRQPGKVRGAVFCRVEKLLSFLRKAEETDRGLSTQHLHA